MEFTNFGHMTQVALEIAVAAHLHETRDDGEAYINHPLRVARILIHEFGILEEEAVALALVHDTLEAKNKVKLSDIEETIYSGIQNELNILTIKNGSTREERDRNYIQNIKKASLRVKLVKLADRIDNIRSLKTNPSEEKKKRYAAETQLLYVDMAKNTFTPAAIALNEALDDVFS
jgi:(p)ppGpp synthase/HD superfamily hydrolase